MAAGLLVRHLENFLRVSQRLAHELVGFQMEPLVLLQELDDRMDLFCHGG